MRRVEGWLFDVYIQNDHAVIWIKTKDGTLLRLVDDYTPSFHIAPRDRAAEQDLLYQLAECREVKRACAEEKVTSLENRGSERLIRVEARGTKGSDDLAKALGESPLVSKLYDADLKHVQRYLFTKLKVEPTSKVEVEHDGELMAGMAKVDDSLEITPPPFKLLRFRVDYEATEHGKTIRGITTNSRGEERTFRGSETDVLGSFLSHAEEADADLLFCPKCDDLTYPLLKLRSETNAIDLRLGRCDDEAQVKLQGSVAGRIMLGDIFYGFKADEWGIAGLVERVRFAFAPIGLVTRWLSNKSIDSRNCFELIRRGYAIPKEEYFERARSLHDLARGDRGGLTMTPEIGRVHEDVAVLDFDSQYPNIMLKNELSYESTDRAEAGAFKLIPTAVGPWLERRLFLKRMRKTLPKGSGLRLYCEQRVEALKTILVTQYGISGCCWNRFGNVLTFEEINRASRDAMLKAKAVAESLGFRVVYADVDSVFVSREGVGREGYEALASKIADATGLPMSLDRHFRFLAFLPLKGDPLSSAMKRYFGLTHEGEVEARGIELRRHDTPAFIVHFQEELIRQVLGCGSAQEVYSEGVRKGMALVRRTLSEIRSGRVNAEGLVVRKRLRKGVGEYRANVAHRSAALQVLRSGGELEVGEDVAFLYVDHDHKDPLCRVRVPERFRGIYDAQEYGRMLIAAASTVFEGLGLQHSFDSGEASLEGWL